MFQVDQDKPTSIIEPKNESCYEIKHEEILDNIEEQQVMQESQHEVSISAKPPSNHSDSVKADKAPNSPVPRLGMVLVNEWLHTYSPEFRSEQ